MSLFQITSALFPYTTLFRSHVLFDVFHRLAGVLGVELVELAAQVQDLACLDLDVGGRPLSPARRLVHHNARDRKSTRLNSSHITISYAVFCLKKKIGG